MARPYVPKFGNWENEEGNVPYTVYFDKARKKRGVGMTFNPNDPQENPDMFPKIDPAPLAPWAEHKTSEESAWSTERNGQRTSERSGYGSRSPKPSGGSDQSFGRSSPLNPHYNANVVMGRGSGWEGRNYDSSHGNIGRFRLRPARGDESPDKGAAVPKFGEWNENDPQSAENFTHIFNKVRNERNTGIGNPSATPKHPSYSTYSQPSDEPKKCCFPWW